jgi:hypothetical protein
MGQQRDQICYNGVMLAGVNLTQDAVKETSAIVVGPSGVNSANAATAFVPGDVILIDQLDDSLVNEGDCTFYKRIDKRSISQRVEIKSVDASTGTLTLTTPLHWTFHAGGVYQAQVSRTNDTATKYAGIESMRIAGGNNPGYDGMWAGGIDISNAANSWVKDIQTGGTIGGVHVFVRGSYRVVVRDSYVHHSSNYGYGVDNYGISLGCGSADGLVENNVVRWMNQPVQLDTSGGGNVIGYNYIDNPWSDATPSVGNGQWLLGPIDTHCSFPHMELIEGNYTPKVGLEDGHGNNGYNTIFRNNLTAEVANNGGAYPLVWGSSQTRQTAGIAAVEFGPDSGVYTNLVGNVLGSANPTTALAPALFESSDNGTPAILTFDGGLSDVPVTTLFATGNYDYFHGSIQWMNGPVALPNSLYYSSKPAWWPSGSPWPWTGSDLSPMVGTLPAKALSDSKYNPSVP